MKKWIVVYLVILVLPTILNAERRGIKIGSFRLFPEGSIEGGYDSNVFYQDSNYEGVYGSAIINIRASALIKNDETKTLFFSNLLKIDGRIYATKNSDIFNQGGVSVSMDTALRYNPRSNYIITAMNYFGRIVEPEYAIKESSINRIIEQPRFLMEFFPGGKALSVGLNLSGRYTYYEEPQYRMFNFGYIEGALMAKWLFYPKTALFFEYDFSYDFYSNIKPNSYPMKAYLGVIGLITTKLKLTAKIGYGNSLNKYGDMFDNVVAEAEVSWKFHPYFNARLAFERNFLPTGTEEYNYVDIMKATAEVTFEYVKYFAMVRYFIEYDAYGLSGINPLNLPNRYELRNNLLLNFRYYILKHKLLWVGLTYRLETNNSSYSSPSEISLNYVKHVITADIGSMY